MAGPDVGGDLEFDHVYHSASNADIRYNPIRTTLPSIEVLGGKVDTYVSNATDRPSDEDILTEMTKMDVKDIGVHGQIIAVRWLAFVATVGEEATDVRECNLIDWEYDARGRKFTSEV